MMVGLQQVGRIFNNSFDYLMGNYAIKKQEKIGREKNLEAVANDYNFLFSEPDPNTPSIKFYEEGMGADSLPGC